MPRISSRLYQTAVIDRPLIVLFALALGALAALYYAKDFKLDASADSLVLENDEDLKYFREINSRYATQDFLVIAYTPKDSLFSDAVLADIAKLRDELYTIEQVDSVITVLDVPLLKSPPVPLTELASNIQNLEKPTVDREAARDELVSSPIYKANLVSADGKTTAIQINLKIDHTYFKLLNARESLRQTAQKRPLTPDEQQQLKVASDEFYTYKVSAAERLHRDIAKVRELMQQHNDIAETHLGGVPMIADDMVTYVENDIIYFGAAVVAFLILTLTVIFRKVRWIILPLITCSLSVVYMIGALGFFDWPVTVISSNFISLLLIITLSMTIHLIVRYRQLQSTRPEQTQNQLVFDTVRSMAKPCFYTALTTIVAFVSLLVSGIRPVIDFGWMMTIGISVAFTVTFLLFPALLMLMGKPDTAEESSTSKPLTLLFARLTAAHGNKIAVLGVLMLVASVVGISRLSVENSFIDYFKQSTEIYQGMVKIDEQLGGTTPLDIIVKLDSTDDETPNEDEWVDEFATFETEDDPTANWFTAKKMAQIKSIHDHVETYSAVGKVLSMETMMRLARDFNDGEPLDNLTLALLYRRIPEEFRAMIIDPYVSIDNDEARITLRIKDSDPTLSRDQLLKDMHEGLINEVGLAPEEFRLTNMLVLYNNMLQSLFQSQILTLGVVFLGIMVMFFILFQSLSLALIAIVPNLLSAGFVLGIMGLLGIPLDIMTITIAAISIGIAVDDTIHFIHRFRVEFKVDQQYLSTMKRCHGSIGKAMMYTSVTIIIGFTILVLSNFIPTIYFGLLTSLAMLIAILAALTLLPLLIIWFKPFGPEVTAR